MEAAHAAEKYKDEATCPLCREADSQQHWIREYQAMPLPVTRRQYTLLVVGDIKRTKDDKHHTNARWVEIALDIAVTKPQEADVWVGMWTLTLTQLLKRRFENSNSTYTNHKNLTS